MSISFKRSELDFINLYNICVDNEHSSHDKFELKVENNKARFLQTSDKCTLISMFDMTSEDFQSIYLTPKVASILNYISVDETVTFDKNKMSFGKNVYEFEEQNISLNDISNLHDIVFNNTPTKKIVLKDLKELQQIESYVGKDDLGTVLNTNNSFITSNENQLTAVIKTENNNNFYIPSLLVNIISKYKIDELEINIFEEQNFISCKVGNTIIIIPVIEYTLPNIFEEQYEDKYNHADTIIVEKDNFLKAIQRIKVVSALNIYSRVFIYCRKDCIEIVSKDKSKAIEIVNATVPESLIDCYYIVSSNFMERMINSFKGKNIVIHANNDPDIIAIKITDEEENKFFINVLYSDIEVDN